MHRNILHLAAACGTVSMLKGSLDLLTAVQLKELMVAMTTASVRSVADDYYDQSPHTPLEIACNSGNVDAIHDLLTWVPLLMSSRPQKVLQELLTAVRVMLALLNIRSACVVQLQHSNGE